jgi:hypothetical protein
VIDDVEYQTKTSGSNPSNRIAGLDFYPPLLFNRGKPASAKTMVNSVVLGVRMTDRAVTSVREFAPQWLLRSFLNSSNSGDVGERRM